MAIILCFMQQNYPNKKGYTTKFNKVGFRHIHQKTLKDLTEVGIKLKDFVFSSVEWEVILMFVPMLIPCAFDLEPTPCLDIVMNQRNLSSKSTWRFLPGQGSLFKHCSLLLLTILCNNSHTLVLFSSAG